MREVNPNERDNYTTFYRLGTMDRYPTEAPLERVFVPHCSSLTLVMFLHVDYDEVFSNLITIGRWGTL